ncbi:hypothetical protein Tco_0610178 [Tanacetum coccineum]
MVGGNEGNQFKQYVGQNVGNQNGYNTVQTVGNQVVQNAVQNPGIQNVGNLLGLFSVRHSALPGVGTTKQSSRMLSIYRGVSKVFGINPLGRSTAVSKQGVNDLMARKGCMWHYNLGFVRFVRGPTVCS